jgi:predicted ATPase
MIFVDRKAVSVPRLFRSRKIEAAAARAQKFFSRPSHTRLQERFEFDARIWASVRRPLVNLFHGKCAYCESPMGAPSSGGAELFRPCVEATGLIPRRGSKLKATSAATAPNPSALDWLSQQKSESDRDHYWWLAYEWENIYLACNTCKRNKRNQFPAIGTRASPGARGENLRKELALLLDPCLDRPGNYLDFNETGFVASAKPLDYKEANRFEGMDRGAITIDVLGLNRSDLVQSRKREIDAIRKQWTSIASDKDFGPASAKRLLAIIDGSRPYAAARRQWIRAQGSMLYKRVSAEARPRLLEALKDLSPDLGDVESAKPAPRKKARRAAPPKKSLGRLQRVSRPPTRVRKQRTIGMIKTIEIENFKAIRQLTLHFPTGTDSAIGWKVLLGENGTGKSSILQAVALTLMGPGFVRRYLREFHLRTADLLRKVRGDKTVSHASVTIEFSTGRKVALMVRKRGFRFVESPPAAMFVRGYGATRLLPRRNKPRVRVRTRISGIVTNLFDPSKPVFNAAAWLARLKSRKDFGSAALSLKDLLNLPGMSRLRVRSGKLEVPINGLIHSVEEMSAGYESVLVMAADIMAGLIGTMRDFRRSPGIVLLDEIDAHLHPRWKMRIVESLRRTFCSMQFLVTTHEPLCLRGIEKGEITVLERTGKDISVLEDLPAPKSLRVDQLLMSNFFGLGSTIDPVVEKEFNRYYELLAKDKLTAAEQKDRDRLRSQVAKYEHRLMANTPGDELLYEAIDEYVAKESIWRGPSRAQLPALREETKRRVKDLWKVFGKAGGTLP